MPTRLGGGLRVIDAHANERTQKHDDPSDTTRFLSCDESENRSYNGHNYEESQANHCPSHNSGTEKANDERPAESNECGSNVWAHGTERQRSRPRARWHAPVNHDASACGVLLDASFSARDGLKGAPEGVEHCIHNLRGDARLVERNIAQEAE